MWLILNSLLSILIFSMIYIPYILVVSSNYRQPYLNSCGKKNRSVAKNSEVMLTPVSECAVKIQWKADLDKRETASLNRGRMFFVNRERPKLQLLDILHANYYRTFEEEGDYWIYAICANDYGAGKSAFVELMTHLVNDKSERPIFLVIDEVAIPVLHPKED